MRSAVTCWRVCARVDLMHVFNLNDSVWVQLTATGRAHLRERNNMRSETIDGWSEWIGWDLMHTFGPLMVMGGEPPFNMDIRLEVADPISSVAAEGHKPGGDWPPPPTAEHLNLIDKRIAELESRVRLTQHRLAAAAQMCADIDRDPRIHTTVQACFSHVGKALESEPQEDDGHV